MFFSRPAGLKWVDRGDALSSDYEKAVLTLDGLWHSLDLSTIIGESKRLVLLRIAVRAVTTNNYFRVRTNGNEGFYNMGVCYTQAADITCSNDVWVYTDLNGVIAYCGENITWGMISITVSGWWI